MGSSRRDFLKNVGKIVCGIAVVGATGPLSSVIASEKEVDAQEDFKWEIRELPCELITETTDSNTEKGYRAFRYKTDYRICSNEINFLINEADKTVKNIEYTDGCDGSTEGVANIADGKEADFIIKRVKGLECNLKKSGSSCPDQLADALEQALNIMSGTACSHCFFAGNFNNAKCTTEFNQFTRA